MPLRLVVPTSIEPSKKSHKGSAHSLRTSPPPEAIGHIHGLLAQLIHTDPMQAAVVGVLIERLLADGDSADSK